jgi:hypothetical protein
VPFGEEEVPEEQAVISVNPGEGHAVADEV